jgi:hypothetical protein
MCLHSECSKIAKVANPDNHFKNELKQNTTLYGRSSAGNTSVILAFLNEFFEVASPLTTIWKII